MSSTTDKFNEDSHIFWEQNQPYKRINNILTPNQAVNILNLLSLKYKFSKEDFKELELVKEHIKSRY